MSASPTRAPRPLVGTVVWKVLPPAVLLFLLAGVWQLVAVHNRQILPSIPAIWSALETAPATYLAATSVTLRETGVGLGASFVLAFSLAIAMSHSRVVERAVMPLAIVLNVTPIVTLAPGLAVALGINDEPRYVVTAIIVFFPLLVNSLVGLRSVDPEALDYFHTLAASRREILLRLRIPSSLPFLFAAARICFPLAVVGAVVSEITASGGSNGLGSLITVDFDYFDLSGAYASIVCLAVLGLGVTVVVMLLERRFLSWHSSQAFTR